MGSDTRARITSGRYKDRVWIDAFELAVCQVTGMRDLRQYSSPKRRIACRCIGVTPSFRIQNRPWSAFRGSDAAACCEMASAKRRDISTACRPKPNGNAPHAAD